MRRATPLFALVAACASGDSGAGAEADARAPADAQAAADAPSSDRPDADRSDCLRYVPSDYGTPTPVDTSYFSGEGNYTFYADLVDDAFFQRLFVSLHEETGVFPGAVQPGTYAIEGDETDYQWCGACVYLAVEDGDTPATLYMATSGKITIDSVGAEIHGSLSSVTLRQIEIAYTGKACGGGGEWPCGNTGCLDGSCGQQVEGPECETYVESFRF